MAQGEIRKILGEAMVGMTATVAVPGDAEHPGGPRPVLTRQVNLIGVDEQTHAEVGDFGQYLQHPEKRRAMSFDCGRKAMPRIERSPTLRLAVSSGRG